jgi:microsomal dipeptidase-like Zn-dependent dipeptidase
MGSFVLALAVVGAVAFFWYAPRYYDAKNLVLKHKPYVVSPRAQALHAELRVADLHADPLLWKRDIVIRNDRGQTDIPRLIEGGYALQVFSAVTKSTVGRGYSGYASDGKDTLTLHAISNGWPVRTWNSITERALYLAWKLADAEKRSGGALRVVRTSSDLRRALDDHVLAGILGMEGGHPLEGKLENLRRLYDGGFRVVGLQHFFDNELGGSLHGMSGAGLTEFGRAVIAEAEAREMIIDVAHSSEASVRDALAVAKRPMILSHTGLKGHCDSPRNISDDLLKKIAEGGGLIGVGFWEGAVCKATFQKIAEAIVYAVKLLGVEHVALGSDFDGGIQVPFDASEMAALTSALLDAGLDDETVRLVMGENAIRFFLTYLPGGPKTAGAH